MKKIFFTILPILWMLVIFMFSAAPADDSSKLSLSVGRIISDIFVPEFDEWSDSRQEAFIERIDYPVRKCAHASEYAVLGALLMITFQYYAASYNTSCGVDNKENGHRADYKYDDKVQRMTVRRSICSSVMIGVVYAASDEFHQLFVPGRAGRITDVMIDSLGLIIGIIFVYAVLGLYSRYSKSHGDKRRG